MNANELFEKHADEFGGSYRNRNKVMSREAFTAALSEALRCGHLQPVVMQDVSQSALFAKVDNYLMKVTTFIIVGKENIKKDMNKLIDEKFKYIEDGLKEANAAIHEFSK